MLFGFIVGSFGTYWLVMWNNFHQFHAYYSIQSAPWYTGVIGAGLIAGVALIVLTYLRHIVKKRKMHIPFQETPEERLISTSGKKTPEVKKKRRKGKGLHER